MNSLQIALLGVMVGFLILGFAFGFSRLFVQMTTWVVFLTGAILAATVLLMPFSALFWLSAPCGFFLLGAGVGQLIRKWERPAH